LSSTDSTVKYELDDNFDNVAESPQGRPMPANANPFFRRTIKRLFASDPHTVNFFALLAALTFFGSFTAVAATDAERATCQDRSASPDQRIEACTAVLQSPNDSRLFAFAHHQRGASYLIKRMFVQAISDFNAALKIDSRLALPLAARALAHKQNSDFSQSLADYDQLIRNNPLSVDYYVMRADVFRELKEWDKAIEDCNRAISLDPKRSKAFNRRGEVLKDKKEYNLALADFDAAVALDANNVAAYENRGLLYLDRGEYANALVNYDQAIRLYPHSASYLARSFIHGKLGNHAQAAADRAEYEKGK
jgi:tetratricopeptide (TPR) repeat protein